MRAWLCITFVALGGCGGVTASPSDGGAADVVQGSVDAGVDATFDAGPPDHAAPTDAPPADAPTQDVAQGGCPEGGETLTVPTFTPPDGTSLQAGDSVTINPAADFPVGGTIYYTTNGTIPTHSSSVYVGPIQINFPLTIFAIATPPDGALCLDDSPAAHASYYISKPSQGDACAVAWPPFQPTSQVATHPFTVTAGLCPGDTLCYRLDGNTPTCSKGACTGGSSTFDIQKGIAIDGTVTDPTTGKVTLTAIACDAQGDQTAVVTQVYQLVLAPPYLASTNPDGVGLPGVGDGGAPVTTMTIPADAGLPYGPFVAQQIGSGPCNSAATCTGSQYGLADSICWSKGTSASCLCASGIPLTMATPYASLPAAADVSPGDTITVKACGQGYLSSATTVQF
jgi:hypothetical protein